MSLIYIIEPLATVLSSAVNKSQQHREKNSWECQGLLGEKQVCCLCSKQPPIFYDLISLGIYYSHDHSSQEVEEDEKNCNGGKENLNISLLQDQIQSHPFLVLDILARLSKKPVDLNHECCERHQKAKE